MIATLVLGVAAVALVYSQLPEPRYRGRRLSDWANDLRSADAGIREAATDVFRHSPDAVRFLSERIATDTGPLDRVTARLAPFVPDRFKQRLRHVYDPARKLLDKHLAAQALQQVGTNAVAAIPALRKMLRDSNVLLTSSAGLTLGQMGTPAVPVLVEALSAPDYNVRASACNALSQIGPSASAAVPLLTEMVQHETGPIVALATYTLSQIRAPAVPALTSLMTNTNAAVRQAAAFALGQMGFEGAEAIPALTAAARHDTNPSVRWAAVDSLGRVSNTSAESARTLVELLDDADPGVRGMAVSALGQRPSILLRNQRKVEALLFDASPMVRSNAAATLEPFARLPAATKP